MKSEAIGLWGSLLFHAFVTLGIYTIVSISPSTKMESSVLTELLLVATILPVSPDIKNDNLKADVTEGARKLVQDVFTAPESVAAISKYMSETEQSDLLTTHSTRDVKKKARDAKKKERKKHRQQSTSATPLKALMSNPATPSLEGTSPSKNAPITQLPSSADQIHSSPAASSLPASYNTHIRIAIMNQKHYPARARRKNQTGKVTVSFRIYANGSYDLLTLVNSSGYDLLDESALKTVKKVGMFHPFPETIALDYQDFTVPVYFKL